MTRISVFVLLRLTALLWVLALSRLAANLGPYGISFCIMVSEALLGYAWGKAEARITICRPSSPDPTRLFSLMVGVAVFETIAAALFIGTYVPWLIVWRAVTAYIPFAVFELLTFRHVCSTMPTWKLPWNE